MRNENEAVAPVNENIHTKSVKQIMQILGNKWAFPVMRELDNGAKRFNELKRAIGCSTQSLSNTLKLLESNGVISRTVLPTTPVTVEYALEEKGRDFEGVFLEMRKWEEKWVTE